MKEIGECFREAREKIGLSKEETIKDLKITVSQLDNLEDGNANAFKDVFFLKDLIRKYSKYLDLDEDAELRNCDRSNLISAIEEFSGISNTEAVLSKIFVVEINLQL